MSTFHIEVISLPLTTKISGVEVVPQRSGLNWGQRPGRNLDQAYIPISAEIQRSNFFPERGVEFLLECDDGQLFKCVRAQANGKALETSSDNSLLGIYFRQRLGVRLGYLVTIDHLLRYGRTSVDVSRKDDFRYFMDFSIVRNMN